MSATWEHEFESLMHRLLDDPSNFTDVEQLERLLAAHPEATDAYVRLVALDTLANECLKGKAPAAGSSSAASEQTPAAKSPVLGFLSGVTDYISHSRTLMLWLIAGSLGLYFVFQLGSLMISRFLAQNAAEVVQNDGAGTEKNGKVVDRADLAPAGKVVARLTNVVDARWRVAQPGGGQPQAVTLAAGTELHSGQRLDLTSGLAEITFNSGATVILNAPAQFAVGDALAGDLQLGKLTAKVPHAAAGFTVSTPGGKVVDLGTEFGVKVNYDRTMHVIVYVGEVEIQSGGGAAGGGAEQSHPFKTKVKAGEAVAVAPGKPPHPTPPQDERFVRDLSHLAAPQDSEAAYVWLIKSLKPAVWFRMEGKPDDRVLHDEMGGPDAKLYWDGPGNPFVKGRVGKALWLRGPALKDCAILSKYTPAENDKLSMVAWVLADSRPIDATIVDQWVGDGQFRFGLYASEAQGNLCAYVRNDGLIRGLEDKHFFAREGEDHPLPLNEWQHVAFTTDGKTLRVYRDGREVAAAPSTSLIRPAKRTSLAIGNQATSAGDQPGSDPFNWSGKLDELAIYHDVLSPETIQKLYSSAPR